MQANDLPLLALFNRLRRAGLPLGLPEYRLVLEALESGFGVPDRAALARLCSTLWVKSEDDQRLFDYHFAAVMAADEVAFEEEIREAIADEKRLEEASAAAQGGPLHLWWKNTSRLTRIALGGSALVGLSLAVWLTRPAKQCPTFISLPDQLVARGESYRYDIEVAPCTGGGERDLEIVALQKHPWLTLQKTSEGVTSLSGMIPEHDIRYSQAAIWTADGEEITDFDGREDISGVFVLSDGERLITPLFDQQTLLWDGDGQLLSDFDNAKGIKEFIVSEDAQSIVTLESRDPAVRFDRVVKLWNQSGQRIADLGEINGPASSSVGFSPDGQFLVTLPSDKKVRLWESTGKLLKTFEGTSYQLDRYSQFSEDSKFLAIGAREGNVQIWQTQPLEKITDFALEDNLSSLVLMQSGERLVVRLDNGKVQLWSREGEKLADWGQVGDGLSSQEIDGQRSLSSQNIQSSRDGQRIIIRQPDGAMHLWDLQGNRLAELGENNGPALFVRFSQDSQQFAVQLSNGDIQLWSAEGQLLADFGKIGRDPNDFRWHRDGQMMVTRLADGTAQLRDDQGKALSDFDDISLRSVTFSANGERMLTHSQVGTAQLWDVKGNRLSDFENAQAVKSVRFVGFGKRILIELNNGRAQLWTDQGDLISEFDQLTNIIKVEFTGNGQRFLTVLIDGTVQLWDADGNAIAEMDVVELSRLGFDNTLASSLGSPLDNASSLGSSQFFVTRSSDGIARIWTGQGDLVREFDQVDSLFQRRYFLRDSFTGIERVKSDQLQLQLFLFDGQQRLIAFKINSSVTLQVTDRETNQLTQQAFELASFSDSAQFAPRFSRWLKIAGLVSAGLLCLGLPVLYVVMRWLAKRVERLPSFPALQADKATAQTASSVLNQTVDDEIKVAQSVAQAGIQTGIQERLQNDGALEAASRHFSDRLSKGELAVSSEYFPVTSRQMQQSWRYLRRLTREGPPVELDVASTVEQASRSGLLVKPVMRPRRVNRNELLLLIDQEGSMVPFHGLSERLVRTAVEGGRLASTGVRYFHNCPEDYLYLDPYHQLAESIEVALSGLHSEFASVLIFSDAGAARGGFSQIRLEMTIAFLERLPQHVRYVAWLNPMPKTRWVGTAGEIAKRVPMFELSRQGLDSCIDVLRGKSAHLTN